MREIIISAQESGGRLDKYLFRNFPKAPKSFIYKMLRKKNIVINGARSDGSTITAAGDSVKLFLSDETMAGFGFEFEGAAAENAAAAVHTADNTAEQRAEKTAFCKHTANASGSAVSLKTAERTPSGSAGGSLTDISRYCSIVYEDDNIIIADKKTGVLSQKTKPGDISINEILKQYKNAGKSASVCNRLDRNTSGLICFAVNYAASVELSRVFRDRTGDKFYIAAVSGKVDHGEHIDAFLEKDRESNTVEITGMKRRTINAFETEHNVSKGASVIETEFLPVLQGDDFTVLKVRLITGKTHQIRAQLSRIGHPVIGDARYGDDMVNRRYRQKYGVRSQLLHAYELVMPDLGGGLLGYLSGRSFKTVIPASFKNLGLKELQ